MANFPIENFYTGYHVTSGLYSTGYADGSLQAQIQQNCGLPSTQICNFNAPYWRNLMTTQQNLFSGWNSFCGCPGTPQQPPAQEPGRCGRQRIDIHVYHDFYRNGCGGPFTCNQGQGASSTSQSYGAFGSHGACQGWQQNTGCYNAFNSLVDSYKNFGYGNRGLFGCAPHPTGSVSSYQQGLSAYPGLSAGYQSSYGGGFGYQGCYGGGYSGGYGGYQGSCGGSYGGGSFQGNTYGLPQSLPSYNWGDFNYSFGGNKNSAFGVVPSAYPSYAMTSPFTNFGTAAGIAALGGALSLLF